MVVCFILQASSEEKQYDHHKKKRHSSPERHSSHHHQHDHRHERRQERDHSRVIVKKERTDDGYENATRSEGRSDHSHRNRQQRERAFHDHRRKENRERHHQEGNQNWTTQASVKKEEPEKEKEKPNFELSGKLTEDTNTYRGVVIKYSEPREARKPKKRWRLYPFKGEEVLPVLHIHRQSAYLLGRDRRVADIPVDHPSCSKQHAALQYRLVPYEREDGTRGRRVRLYVIDLGSANGTYVNNKRIDPERYVELMEKDVLKFGFSTREYVLLPETADTRELDDEADLSE